VGILFASMLPLIGLLRFGDLREQFFPGADRDQFFVQVWMPRDSSLKNTRRTAQAMEDVIQNGLP
jgi:multidrug efflux pump subunit AcrB